MQQFPLLGAILFLLLIVKFSPGIEAKVEDLTNENFESRVRDGLDGVWFVKFFAPWCSHCKTIQATWEEAAVKLEGSVHVGQVNAVQEMNITKSWGITAFPTLILIRDGKVFNYAGRRRVNEMVAFALEGWKSSTNAKLPRERTWMDNMWARRYEYFLFYTFPALLCFSFACQVMLVIRNSRRQSRFEEGRSISVEEVCTSDGGLYNITHVKDF